MEMIEFSADLAFKIAKSSTNAVSKNLDNYMFMYADSKDLHFKHIMTRRYILINHSRWKQDKPETLEGEFIPTFHD